MADRNKNRYEIEKILKAEDGGVHSTRGIGGILAALWRQILFDTKMDANRFDILLQDYIHNAKRGVPANRVSRHFTRGNLRRELEKSTMTFKVFMKGMKFLKVRRIKFAVELIQNSGRKTIHQVSVDLGSQQINEDFANDVQFETSSDMPEVPEPGYTTAPTPQLEASGYGAYGNETDKKETSENTS